MNDAERDMAVVRSLNSVFERFDFVTLRDALEGSDAVALTAELGELSREFAEAVDEDVVVEFVSEQPLIEGQVFFGAQGWIELWAAWLAAFDSYTLTSSDYEMVGDRVVAKAVHRGRGRFSGLELELEHWQVWELSDGRVVSVRMYDTREQALARAEGSG
jgi:ketosteroid isomerase-like protein